MSYQDVSVLLGSCLLFYVVFVLMFIVLIIGYCLSQAGTSFSARIKAICRVATQAVRTKTAGLGLGIYGTCTGSLRSPKRFGGELQWVYPFYLEAKRKTLGFQTSPIETISLYLQGNHHSRGLLGGARFGPSTVHRCFGICACALPSNGAMISLLNCQ